MSQALAELSEALQQTSRLTVDEALALAELIPVLHQAVGAPAGPTPETTEPTAEPSVLTAEPAESFREDPRFALALASIAESAAHHALRTQIYAAHLLEATSAHTLTVDELNAQQAGTIDFTRPAERTGQRATFTSTSALLSSWLHIEHHEALRRVASANHVFAQFDYQHQQYPAQFPLLTQRFNDPTLPPAEALSVARRLGALEPVREEFDAPTTSTVRGADGQLLEAMLDHELGEADPATRRKGINAVIKSAKEQKSEEQPEAQEGIFRRGLRHGLVRYELALRPTRAELFESGIAQSDNPRSDAGQAAREAFIDNNSDPADAANPTNASDASDATDATTEHPDFVTDEEAAASEATDTAPITPAARRLNGLMSLLELNSKLLQRLLDATLHGAQEDAQATAGSQELKVPVIKPQVVVTISLAELEGRADTFGITSHGFKLSATDLRQTLAKARIIPIVLGGKGEILDIGRAQRKHPNYMRLGVAVRDRGCLVPGCTMDPERCNIHHVWFWSEGGVTAVYWSAMLCDTHHHDVHAGLIKVIPNDGVPQVILPAFMDPTQTPVRNQYHFAATT